MISRFEDHCWKDIISLDVLEIYSHYARETFVGLSPALLAVDLYELAYQGGPKPISDLHRTYPSTCGENAYAAIKPTMQLFAAARAARIPIFYSTQDVSFASAPSRVVATNRQFMPADPSLYEIKSEFKPQSGDVIISKQRASCFFGTPLIAHLTKLGIQTVIIFGESTSGCVRATAVDAYSNGFHVVVVEECCFDRSMLSHKASLFDMHHKYTDVMHVDEVIEHLRAIASGQPSRSGKDDAAS